MDEHDDDLEPAVDDEADGFPRTAEDIENAADEEPDTEDEPDDPSEL